MATTQALKPIEVQPFRQYCERKGYFVVSTGPKEFVFIAGKHGKQVVPIVQAGKEIKRA